MVLFRFDCIHPPLLVILFSGCISFLGGCASGWAARAVDRSSERAVCVSLNSDPSEAIFVYQNGIHSGFIIRGDELPWSIKLNTNVLKAFPDAVELSSHHRSMYVEVGFGNKSWVLGEDRSTWRAFRLLVLPDEGCLMVNNLNAGSYGYIKANGRIWPLKVTPAQRLAFINSLKGWINFEGNSYVAITNGLGSEYYTSTANYGLLWNCHDWTALELRTMGISMPSRLYRTSNIFTADLDQALACFDSSLQ